MVILCWTIIRWRFGDIQNNPGRGKGYQLKPKAEADNTHRDLDYSGYHTEPNLIIVLLHADEKKRFCFFTEGKQHKARELDPWPWVFSTWLLHNLQLWHHWRWFRKFAVRFRPVRKELESSMYNNMLCHTSQLKYVFRLEENVSRAVGLNSLTP